MKALTFTGKESISYETISDPAILRDTDVIVRVKACAICGSDLHVYHGRESGIDLHTAMGHEFAGEIVGMGPGVGGPTSSLRAGQRVTVDPMQYCGTCDYCQIGRAHV